MASSEMTSALAEQFQVAFTRFTTSNAFKTSLKKLNLFDVKFEIITEKHADEAIDILCQQFSVSGGGHRAQLFDSKPSDLYPYFKIVIQHAIRTKLSYVAIQNDKIIYVVVSFDLFDVYSVSQSMDNLSLNLQATIKYFGFIASHNDTLIKLKQNCKYGEVNYYGFGAISPSFGGGKALSPMITAMHWIVLLDMKSIKYATHSYSHPKSAYYALNKLPAIFSNIYGLKWQILGNYNYADIMNRFFNKNENKHYQRYLNIEYLQKLKENNVGFVWALTSYDRKKLSLSMEEIWVKVLRKIRPSIFSKL